MQANNSPRFLKNFMIGLVASSAGAFIALPGSAMPELTETGTEIEAVDSVAAPAADEALPMPEAGMAPEEEDTIAEDAAADVDADTVEAAEIETLSDDAIEASDTMDGEPVVEDVDAMEEPVADDTDAMEEPVADDVDAMEEPVADDADAMEEPVADETDAMEEPVADETDAMEEPVADETDAMEEPVADETDADTVEAAEIEALSDDAIEASDTMDGEPVVEDVDAMEEPVADDTDAMEEPVADDTDAMEEPVATEEMNTADFTIAELTDNSDSFEILAAALAAADLTEILGGEGPFTIFAPTDDAFAALPEGAVDQLLLPENKDVLVQVLTYHVVPGALLSTDLESGGVATVEGSEVALNVDDTVTVNNANVVVADVEASNGVIHIIDRVIIPPSPETDAAGEEIAPVEEAVPGEEVAPVE